MKTPDFMNGAVPVKMESMKFAEVNQSHIRGVSWLSSPEEPALPDLGSVTIPMKPPESPPLAPDFVALESAPAVDVEKLRDEALEQVRGAVEALKAQGERLAEQARSDALELGILIAKRILEREISGSLDGLFSLIKSAIRRAGEDHITRIRLHPQDVERLQQAAQSEFSLGPMEVVSDASLAPGDVVVETEHHSIDGRLATRFEELVRQLEGHAQ
jgi:flagellar assembly protein FliH